MLAAVSCTDKSDYNTAYDDGIPTSGSTLWENISSDPQLKKYAALVKKAGYDQDFSRSGYHTVWAPVDEFFSDAEYNELIAKDSAALRREFVQQHLLQFSNLVPAEEKRVVTLNDKHHVFSPEGFDGVPYISNVSGEGINIPAANGLIHKIKGQSAYHPNLYQFIDNLEGCDSIKNYLQKYDELYVDTRLSVPGPIKDGEQTYTYTVWAKRNNVIEKLIHADLENEDSTYCILFPTDKVWQETAEVIKAKYNYIPKVTYKDLSSNSNGDAPNFTSGTSLSNMKTGLASAAIAAKKDQTNINVEFLLDTLTKKNIIENIVYSNGWDCNKVLFDGTSAADTLYSTSRSHITSVDSILKSTIETVEMSNGISRIVDAYPFYAHESYEPITGADAVYQHFATKLTSRSVAWSELEGRMDLFSKVPEFIMKRLKTNKSQFFSYVDTDPADISSTSAKVQLDFALADVLATAYRILVVTVPRQVREPAEPERSFNFRFFLSYTDAENKQQYITLPAETDERAATLTEADRYRQQFSTAEGTSAKGTYYTGDPGKLNVIDLGEFTFPISYYGLQSQSSDGNYAYPSLIMAPTVSFSTGTNRNKYDQYPRIAGVYLVPKAYYDSLQK